MSQARPPTPPFGRTVKLQQGYEMHYLEHGSGPPVVFVHGSGPGVNAHSNFFPNYKVLAAAGYRCGAAGHARLRLVLQAHGDRLHARAVRRHAARVS